MEFELTQEQELLRAATQRFLDRECPIHHVRELATDEAGFDRELWKTGASLGWTSMLVDEAYGGGSVSGSGLLDLVILAEELGAQLHPAPLVSANVIASSLNSFGNDDQRSLLPAMCAGELIATWCLAGPKGRWTADPAARAKVSADGFILEGSASFVEFAHVADVFLVTATTDSANIQLLVPAGTAGITIRPLNTLDLTRRLSTVRFENVAVSSTNLIEEAGVVGTLDRQLQVAIAIQCAETVGALDRVFHDTLQYARDRVAFGRPIGSYQAIKHRFADMMTGLEACKATASTAARAVQSRTPNSDTLVSVAKSYIGDTSRQIASDCQQIQGGIAMTWDHDLHLYLRRIASNAVLFGSPSEHRERLTRIGPQPSTRSL